MVISKKYLLLFLVLLVNASVLADADHASIVVRGQNLIEQGIPCSQLSDEQLEVIGEYYMEQMHPGEAHDEMDAMMGGEGSASLRQMHISMARRIYCNENVNTGMMGGMMMTGMMGSSGMTGGTIGLGMGSWMFAYALIIALGILGLIYVISSSEPQKRKRKK